MALPVLWCGHVHMIAHSITLHTVHAAVTGRLADLGAAHARGVEDDPVDARDRADFPERADHRVNRRVLARAGTERSWVGFDTVDTLRVCCISYSVVNIYRAIATHISGTGTCRCSLGALDPQAKTNRRRIVPRVAESAPKRGNRHFAAGWTSITLAERGDHKRGAPAFLSGRHQNGRIRIDVAT